LAKSRVAQSWRSFARGSARRRVAMPAATKILMCTGVTLEGLVRGGKMADVATPERSHASSSAGKRGCGVVGRGRTLLATPTCAWQNLAQGRSVVIAVLAKRVCNPSSNHSSSPNVIFCRRHHRRLTYYIYVYKIRRSLPQQ